MAEEVVDDGFRISARPLDPGLVLVHIVGDLDLQTVPQATAFLTQATAARPQNLVLDLSGVTFLSSSGIGLLLAAQSGDEQIHGTLRLLGVTGNPPVERPLSLVRLLGRFDIDPDLDTLLARLHRSGPSPD